MAFGGNRTSGSIDVTPALLAQPGSGWKGDFESETFITHALRGEGFDASEDGTGRGTPLVPVGIPQTYAKTHKPASTTDAEGWSPVEASPTITHWFRDRSDTGTDVAVVQSIGVTLHGTDGTQSVASFTDLSSSLRARIPSGVENSTTTAVLQPVVQSFTSDGVVADPISANEGRTYTHEGTTFRLHNCVGMPEVQAKDVVALQDVRDVNKAQNGRGWNDDGAAYTVDTHATQGVAVAFQERGREHGRELEIGGDVAYALTAPNGGGRAQERNLMTPAMQVRRLTPRECERLQGFPDDYTAIPWRGKPASECPDGPRYKALGNSWAVPVVRWIGARIQRNLT